MLNGISWVLVQKMMIDAPSYDYNDDGEDNVKLTEGNAEQILDYINSMI